MSVLRLDMYHIFSVCFISYRLVCRTKNLNTIYLNTKKKIPNVPEYIRPKQTIVKINLLVFNSYKVSYKVVNIYKSCLCEMPYPGLYENIIVTD